MFTFPPTFGGNFKIASLQYMHFVNGTVESQHQYTVYSHVWMVLKQHFNLNCCVSPLCTFEVT